mmetsp:Transcript_32688/g.63868  ORF Transcript_32688/g.63868 Transcript_32688/m.63868 type:complete len:251 (-) Transcript_32688:26-778(-)
MNAGGRPQGQSLRAEHNSNKRSGGSDYEKEHAEESKKAKLSLVSMMLKQRDVAQTQPPNEEGASVRTAAEATAAVTEMFGRNGSRKTCDVGELKIVRPDDAGGAVEKALPGIQGLYHFVYNYTDDGGFAELRVFAHEGIGEGVAYSAAQCDAMWRHAGLDEECRGELHRATCAGAGVPSEGRILRGDVHKEEDVNSKMRVREKRADKSALKEREKTESLSEAILISLKSEIGNEIPPPSLGLFNLQILVQ